MSYHKDPEVNAALVKLMDALCTWERGSGRRSTLVLIPHCVDEAILVAQDGKPLLDDRPGLARYPVEAVKRALRDRGECFR